MIDCMLRSDSSISLTFKAELVQEWLRHSPLSFPLSTQMGLLTRSPRALPTGTYSEAPV